MTRILIQNKQKDLPLSVVTTKKMVKALLEHLQILTDEVTIHFVSKKTMCQVHETFFQDPSPTDSMSFPMDPPYLYCPPHILGEIFVCPHTALAYVQKHGGDPYTETTLYLIHGILHLAGYDDTTPKQRSLMRKKEKQALLALQSHALQKKLV